MNVENTFGIIDYCMFAGVLVISSGIGFYFSYIGNKSPEEFLMGNRNLKTLPVAMSLLTSYISAISLLGFSGEVYGNGLQIGSIILGGPSALIFASYFVLPVLYPLKLTSINEYIELRFKSKNLRVAVFIPIYLKAIFTSAVALYATSLALAPIANFDNLTNILLLGIICTIYSSFGGIRAIVWTDVFQLIIMMVGFTTIVTIGIIQNGGFIETLHTASKGGRMEFFDMRLNPFLRFSFINSFIYSFSSDFGKYVSDQICCQRLYAVKNIDNAKKVIQYNIYGKVIIYLLIFCGGLMAYATYAGCDPMALGLIKKKDQILPFFVMDKLSLIPGLPGLFVAALLGGTLSTISSWLNSCVALMWRDVFLKFDFFKSASPSCATLTNKIISLLVGAVLTGLAIIASSTNGLVVIIVILYGILTGPPLGVFLIGYFVPKCNLKGVWTGYIVSSALLLWITIGNFLYKYPAEMLPFSADECIESNFTSANITGVREYISPTNSTIENINTNTSFIVSLYQISSSLYIFFGSLICVLLAVSVSYLTGNEKIEKISPKLISPCVRKFYWTKEELANFHDNEAKDDNYE